MPLMPGLQMAKTTDTVKVRTDGGGGEFSQVTLHEMLMPLYRNRSKLVQNYISQRASLTGQSYQYPL